MKICLCAPDHSSSRVSPHSIIAACTRQEDTAFDNQGSSAWHSSVHGHWLLVRLVRTFPDADFVQPAREALRQSLTAEKITQEAAYLRAEGRSTFERPYGLSWLLQLTADLRDWDDPQAKEIAANPQPLTEAAVERLSGWLPSWPTQ
jgi:hypothetical protein